MGTRIKRYFLNGGEFDRAKRDQTKLQNGNHASIPSLGKSGIIKQGVFVSEWSIFEQNSTSQSSTNRLDGSFINDWGD